MDLMAYVPHFTEGPSVERMPVVKHVCEQPRIPDELENFKQRKQSWTKLNIWFLTHRILSKKHPFTRWCLKSTTAVDYEISRHLKSHPHMIHPFSNFRICWESFMTIFTIVALLVTPITITFYYRQHDNWHAINDTMNIVFICDIVVWFFTGYYDYRTKVIVLDPLIVARKYLQSYFLIDVVTVLPIEIVDYIIPSTAWYCTTLNMMKILRIYGISFQIHKILETITVITICVHWAACLEYYVPLSVQILGTLSNDSWINSPYFKNKNTNKEKYLVCLNRAMISFVHSGHYLAMKTSEDIILNMILTIVGFLGVMYLLSQLSQLLTTFYISIKRNLKIIQQLQEYMRYKELPHSLQRRLLAFYRYRNKRCFERDKKIINGVSPYLREELILHNYKRLINNVELLKHLPDSVVADLTGALHSEIFMTGDEIIKAGSTGDALYFVSSGTVAVYTTTGKEVCHLEDGSYFGEIALVMDSEHRIATVTAVETCEIYVLKRDDFRKSIAPYPDLLNRLQNIALEHLNQSLLLDVAEDLMTSSTPQYINISSIKNKRL